MSLQPRRPLLDSLRDILRKIEADAETDSPNLADLKRILRERIATIEGHERLLVAGLPGTRLKKTIDTTHLDKKP